MSIRASIESALQHQPDKPVATSRTKHWDGVTADVHGGVKQFELDAPALDHHIVIYTPHGTGRMMQKRAGQAHESVIRTGSVIIMPAGHECTWRGTATPTVRLRMPVDLFADVIQEMGMRPNQAGELLNVFHTRDPLIAQISGIFAGELERAEHPAQALIIDSASCMLAGHLLRSYDAFGVKTDPPAYGLGPRALNQAISHIEEHFDSPIRLDDLSRLTNVSRFHFARMFKASTGMTPMAFVEHVRIERARDLIRSAKLSLAEIAITVGFSDQSHFTRRFYLHANCTPAEFARHHAAKKLPTQKASA